MSIGAYVTKVNGKPVFTKEEINVVISIAREEASEKGKATLLIAFAPDKGANLAEGTPHMGIDQLHVVVRALYKAGEGETLETDAHLTDDEILAVVAKVKKRSKGSQVMRRKLLGSDAWPVA